MRISGNWKREIGLKKKTELVKAIIDRIDAIRDIIGTQVDCTSKSQWSRRNALDVPRCLIVLSGNYNSMILKHLVHSIYAVVGVRQ